MKNSANNNKSIFENIRRIDDFGKEFWNSRDLAKAFDYSDYRNFEKVIERSKEAFSLNNQKIEDHFVDLNEMVTIGSGAKRELRSTKLTKYACYLISLNVDRSKTSRDKAESFFIDKSFNKTIDTPFSLRKLSINDETTSFLLYTAPNGDIKVEAILSNETIWLTQDHMSLVFDVNKPAISKHLKNIFDSNELDENSVVSILETTASDGKIYQVNYYNLDAVISVGYRVNSTRATQFRIWATGVLKEYMIKGFAMDDDRLKNGRFFGKDYFKELLERIRSIRASERRIYQKITDIFAECSIDYDSKSSIAHEFYAEVQNKFHYAITGKTAPEIIYLNAKANEEFMGLKTFKNAPTGRVLISDAKIAKNYLAEDQIRILERTVSSYFDYIERLIETRTDFTMAEFAGSVNKFLEFNEFKILKGKGTVSRQQADEKAENEYESFNKRQKIESDFDRIVKQLESKKDEAK